MAVSSVHIELDKFFHETRGLNKDNCWEWFESFRNTLLYKGYEENPHPYAMYLLDEMECYSAYCAVGNIEGRVVAELDRKKEQVTYEAVYNICVEKKGEEYLNLKEKEARYIESHPEANKWKSNGRRAAKSSSTKPKEGSKKDAENPEPQDTEETPAPRPEPERRPAAPQQQPRQQAQPAAQKAAVKKPDQLVWGQFENVFLTQKQHDDFCVHVGNVNEAKQIIDSLSCKLEEGSFNSSNHYATLTHWANYRKEKAAEAAETAKARAAANAEAFGNVDRRTPYQKNQDELHQLYVLTSEKLKELK